jgi:hypothetical protein
VVQNCCNHIQDDDGRRRLECVLLRMRIVVEEAEGRCITNRGMLLQLKTLNEGMYVVLRTTCFTGSRSRLLKKTEATAFKSIQRP